MEVIKLSAIAINKFMFYIMNYDVIEYKTRDGNTVYIPKSFISIKWNCDIEDIIAIWYNTCKDINGYFLSFYQQLDAENKKAFIEWVMDNYNDEQKLY